jgi:energy-coupling factor transporter transmembrane protein EcfT
MKDLIGFIISCVLGILLQYFFPWWTIVFAGLPAALFFYANSSKSFWLSFSAIVIPWLLIPLFIDYSNQHILAHRMQNLFMNIPIFAIQFAISVLVSSLSGTAALTVFTLKKQLSSDRQK